MKLRYRPLFAPEAGFGGGGGGAAAPAAVAPAAAAPGAATPGATAPPGSFNFSTHIGQDGSFPEGAFSAERAKDLGLEGLDVTPFQKYKSYPELLKGFSNAQKMLGSRGVQVPQEGSAPEVVAEYRKQVGVPDTADGYVLKPEKLPAGVVWEDAKAKPLAELFHKNNIPQKVAAELINAHLTELSVGATSTSAAFTAKVSESWNQSLDYLKSEYGDSHTERLAVLRDYASTIPGLDLADPHANLALSMPWVVKLLDESAKNMREQPLPGTNHSSAIGSQSYIDQARMLKLENPGWRSVPVLKERVESLYAMHTKQEARKNKV